MWYATGPLPVPISCYVYVMPMRILCFYGVASSGMLTEMRLAAGVTGGQHAGQDPRLEGDIA